MTFVDTNVFLYAMDKTTSTKQHPDGRPELRTDVLRHYGRQSFSCFALDGPQPQSPPPCHDHSNHLLPAHSH